MGYERAVVKATAVGVLAAAAARFLGPAAAALAADGIPRARDAAAAWLTPPYLYLVINAIIISIAASSRFQPSSSDRPSASAHMDPEPADVAAVEPPPAPMQVAAPVPAVAVVRAEEFGVAEEPVVTGNTATPAPAQVPEKEEDEEEFSISRSSWTPRRRVADPVAVAADKEPVQDDETAPFADLTNNSREKPLVSSRFSRKAAKASPEGSRALRRVARPRKEETLESTWKAITEGRAPPLARHLKKSDTWDTRPGRRPSGGSGEVVDPAAGVAAAPPAMRKAETFNDGRSSKAPAPVRREPSLGQDELNRRVEAFINKFNMEMRLQRQESLKQYNEMLRHGRDGVY